ncbi:polysaccharide deacetylase family protein [Clostridium kluyveri]|uniref:polysaccharide deacetylase family protein n=1 Tax=Clostridium kluyveri TaxID=1534 RepID=UPI002245898B|nr:polysaccharide deacetylase family protein [Clostridium kluyveri]UZQ52004.1 polysaccharide deacetylase [Clostridium kluyveri]
MEYKNSIIINSIVFIIMVFAAVNLNVTIVMAESTKQNTEKSISADEKKIIYLTFDDGPSNITNNILNILREKNVKATFFVIGNQIPDNESIIRRIASEGHSIGLHTYTHKYGNIYKSSDNFIKEMNITGDMVKKMTGLESHIIRFPGGSRKHLNNKLLQKLHENKFKIYDWNIQASDGINAKTSPYKIFKETTTNPENLNSIILLMHCDYMHKNTCIALPKVIDYYKNEGYEFKIITEDTEELYFPISTKRTSGFFKKILTN